MFANLFTTIIVQPIFNVLVFIYAIIPGHNFGLAIILFTILVRLLLWPLVRKQLHHARAMRQLQPEIKKIKAKAKGDRQKESALVMELYKEKEINPFSSIGIMIVQVPILIGLYLCLRKIIDDPHNLVTFTYPFINHLSWMQTLSHNIHLFDESLFGVVDLTKTAVGKQGGVYWPAMIIVVASAILQFLQSRQLMPKSQDSRGLRQILRDAGQGRSADQSEVNAAVGRSTMYLIPFMVFIISIRLAAALPLYWLVSSAMAYLQQSIILREDVTEAEAIADKTDKTEKADKADRTDKISKADKQTASSRAEKTINTKAGAVTVRRRTISSQTKKNRKRRKR